MNGAGEDEVRGLCGRETEFEGLDEAAEVDLDVDEDVEARDGGGIDGD